MDKDQRVGIIGAGTAGLATSIFLRRQGVRVDLFEAVDELQAIGAGILIQPTGLHVLKQLGLADQIIQSGSRIDVLDGRNHRDKKIMDMRYQDLDPGCFGVGLHRGNLFKALYDLAVAEGVNIRLGIEVIEIDERDGSVGLGSVDGRFNERYDAVVVANGTRSALRKYSKTNYSEAPYPWGALWAIVDWEDFPHPRGLMQKYHGPQKMMGLLPTGVNPITGKKCVSFFWSLPVKYLADWEDTDFDQWKLQLVNYWPKSEYLLQQLTDRTQLAFARYADVRMKRWHTNRVVYIGDAAHAMSPQLGQGANMALVDALCLADACASAGSWPEGFGLYQNKRLKHLRYYQWASRWLTPLFQSNLPLVGTMRDAMFPLMNKVGFARRHSLLTLAGNKRSLLSGHRYFD